MATKQTNFFNTSWSDRTSIEKAALLFGGAFLTYQVYKKGGKFIESLKSRKIAQTYTGDLNALIASGDVPTFLDSQYLIFADTLLTAMDSSLFDWGTDEETVKNVFQRLNTDADVNKLISAFGRKDGYTLPEWIAGDFSNEDKNFYINTPLASKGIKYRF